MPQRNCGDNQDYAEFGIIRMTFITRPRKFSNHGVSSRLEANVTTNGRRQALDCFLAQSHRKWSWSFPVCGHACSRARCAAVSRQAGAATQEPRRNCSSAPCEVHQQPRSVGETEGRTRRSCFSSLLTHALFLHGFSERPKTAHKACGRGTKATAQVTRHGTRAISGNSTDRPQSSRKTMTASASAAQLGGSAIHCRVRCAQDVVHG